MPFTGDTVFAGVLDICTFGRVDTCDRPISRHLLDRVCADVCQTPMPDIQVMLEKSFDHDGRSAAYSLSGLA